MREYILTPIAILIVIFFAIGFVHNAFNPLEWDRNIRIFYLLVSGCALVMWYLKPSKN